MLRPPHCPRARSRRVHCTTVGSSESLEWITFSAYFLSQDTTEAFLGDYVDANPIYATGLELGQYGQAEPNLPSWGSVRGAIQDAFFAILDADSEEAIQQIIADLDATAAELLAESQ